MCMFQMSLVYTVKYSFENKTLFLFYVTCRNQIILKTVKSDNTRNGSIYLITFSIKLITITLAI
jgi:hypothetical protein